MPQERGNVAFVETHRLGAIARRHRDVPGMLTTLLNGQVRYEKRDLYGTDRIVSGVLKGAGG